MNGMIDIVIIALIAAFVALRLRSVLGRKGGAERPERMEERLPENDPFAPPPPPSSRPTEAYRDIPSSMPAETAPPAPPVAVDPAAEAAIAEIEEKDKGFDLGKFMEGARSAYEMILEGFWKGDAAAIRSFLSSDVHESFSSVIAAREAEGLKVENRLIAIEDASVAAAHVEGGAAEITVKFKADIVSVTRNSEGRVVEGNLSDAVVTTDVWTFRRTLGNSDPNWTLVATRAA